jgi:hypothetical protein
MRVIRISLGVLLVVAIQAFCYADVTKLSTEDRKTLQDSSRFHEVYATTNLPPAVVTLCVDDNGRLAEPGQNWEPTDVIMDSKLPRKRLIWAATDGEYFVVHYERGGIAHSFHILVAELKHGSTNPRVIWRGVGRQLGDYKAFLAALDSNKLDDSLEYGY